VSNVTKEEGMEDLLEKDSNPVPSERFFITSNSP